LIHSRLVHPPAEIPSSRWLGAAALQDFPPCAGLRRKLIIDGAGHFIQQELRSP